MMLSVAGQLTFFYPLASFTKKRRKGPSFLCCRNFLAGVSGLSCRSLRPLGFSCHLAKVWCGTGHPSGVPPEGARSLREAGVSTPGDRSLRPGPRPRQVSARVRSIRLPRSFRDLRRSLRPFDLACKVWGATGAMPGGTPEEDQSLRPTPESPALLVRSLRHK